MKHIFFFWDMRTGKTLAVGVKGGQDSIVGLKTRYGLDGLEFKMRWV
jgi:hypothetical protein